MVFGLFKKKTETTIVEEPKVQIEVVSKPAKPKEVKYVNKNIVINDMMNNNPELYHALAGVMMGYGLHCVGCSASTTDTIETGAKIHGMSDIEIDTLVKEVNQVLDGTHPAMKN